MKGSAFCRIAALVLALGACSSRPDPLPGFPRLVLWAWERPERMEFVDPQVAAVAYLARTVSWYDGRTESRPRMQPLQVRPGVRLIAVFRLQGSGPLPDAASVADLVLRDAAQPGISALEIDFDARRSERLWYAGLLKRLRAAGLPSTMPLTMTALASWCVNDPWIRGLPVNDAVPMLFRMGAGEPRTIRNFRVGLCRSSLGVSTDELPDRLPAGKRLYVFHPRAWTEEAYRGAVVWAGRWR
jgi:hypothetical protein